MKALVVRIITGIALIFYLMPPLVIAQVNIGLTTNCPRDTAWILPAEAVWVNMILRTDDIMSDIVTIDYTFYKDTTIEGIDYGSGNVSGFLDALGEFEQTESSAVYHILWTTHGLVRLPGVLLNDFGWFNHQPVGSINQISADVSCWLYDANNNYSDDQDSFIGVYCTIDGNRGDINRDGVIDQQDLLIIFNAYRDGLLACSSMRFNETGINLSLGLSYFGDPNLLDAAALGIWQNNPADPRVANIHYNELMSVIYDDPPSVIVSFEATLENQTLTVEADADMLLAQATLSDGHLWQAIWINSDNATAFGLYQFLQQTDLDSPASETVYAYPNYEDQIVIENVPAELTVEQIHIEPVQLTATQATRDLPPIPTKIRLMQNYPNPFNPVTTISFDLPVTSEVSLTVYNVNGQAVETLVNEQRPAGTFNVSFDGSRLSSGTYFYTLNAGEVRETRKMVLVK